MQIHTLNLIDATLLTTRVKHFIFRHQDPIPLRFIPGQFITIHFEEGDKKFKRSYSIANAPRDDNTIEFAAGYVEGGPATKYLFNLQPGASVQITGPFGRLILKDKDPQRYILAATSTGITPYRSMLPELERRLRLNAELKIIIMLGVRTEKDGLYCDELTQFAKNFPNRVTFRLQLSQPESNLRQENTYQGYIQHAFREINLDPRNDLVYLCGNPSMIDEAFALLKQQGFGVQEIIREKYISSK